MRRWLSGRSSASGNGSSNSASSSALQQQDGTATADGDDVASAAAAASVGGGGGAAGSGTLSSPMGMLPPQMLTFGGGGRYCLGANLAWAELKVGGQWVGAVLAVGGGLDLFSSASLRSLGLRGRVTRQGVCGQCCPNPTKTPHHQGAAWHWKARKPVHVATSRTVRRQGKAGGWRRQADIHVQARGRNTRARTQPLSITPLSCTLPQYPSPTHAITQVFVAVLLRGYDFTSPLPELEVKLFPALTVAQGFPIEVRSLRCRCFVYVCVRVCACVCVCVCVCARPRALAPLFPLPAQPIPGAGWVGGVQSGVP